MPEEIELLEEIRDLLGEILKKMGGEYPLPSKYPYPEGKKKLLSKNIIVLEDGSITRV